MSARLRRTADVILAETDHRRNEVHLPFDLERVSKERLRERIRGTGFDPA